MAERLAATDPALMPRSAGVIRDGIEGGLHTGAAVYASLQGDVAASFALGDASPDVPMTVRSIVPWFSSSKPFGAVAIARLRERDLLDFDDPVAKFIGGFAGNGKDGVTLRHILTHTAGLSIFTEPPDIAWDEIIATICAADIQPGWVVGETAGYDPLTGWYLLGEVVRRLDGRDYGRYVREEIFEPLGMADSWMSLTAEQFGKYGDRIALMPRADRSADGTWRQDRAYYEEQSARINPAGSGIGPVADLGIFYEALLEGYKGRETPILRSESARLITSRHRIGKPDLTMQHVMDWGLGFLIDSKRYGPTHPYGFGRYASDRAFGHGGIQSSGAFGDPESGLALAYYFNGRPGELAHHRRSQQLVAAVYEDLGLAS